MNETPVYLDNHATTRVDDRVVAVMIPYFTGTYGNAGSVGHVYGETAKEAGDQARASIAQAIGAQPREIIFTSGATESNNLALRGVLFKKRRRGDHVISVTTEHKAVLDPLSRLSRQGYEVTLLSPKQAGDPQAGLLDPQQVEDAIRDDTAIVSVMLANNEIGVIQPLAEIGEICKRHGVLLHCDATQAVGKIPVDVEQLQVDLMSFSAHKMYGPKGVGALYVRSKNPRVRLEPQTDGGGQERGVRSGTLNVPGIVGFAKALEICLEELPDETIRLAELRRKLFEGLSQEISGVGLNGPDLDLPGLRLPGNLNVSFNQVEGEALMMNVRQLAVSSGSACTSANPQPSHVLLALGLSEDETRSSLRFGIGRFNTEHEIQWAIEVVSSAVTRLRELGGKT
ncbi:MAG: IscS subfamily cysteine desulfurase [Blastopirellula sp.]|nr:MAG: IscS subfamily cysteine desulfurase [Blastopirellula sp.]